MILPKAWYESPFINIALGKPAFQSSLSAWSTPAGAGGLINGNLEQNFGFHTDLEDSPWWRVDLLRKIPIEAIVVHNRLDILQDRARTLKIEISDDGEVWTQIHAGLSHFGSSTHGTPFFIPLGGKIWARHIRLSLTERQYFHLSQVEIIVDERKSKFVEIREELRLDTKLVDEEQVINIHTGYELVSRTNDFFGPLIGLSFVENAPFGNGIVQYLHGILIARKLGLKYIRVAGKSRNELMRLEKPLGIDGITFLPAAEPLPQGGVFLSGFYFEWAPFARLCGGISGATAHEIIKHEVKRLFNVLPECFTEKPADELLIHIRSGDIFANWINPEYVQPPLAFYKLVIERLISSGDVRSVKLVYENKLNPVIDPLEAYLQARKIPFSVQSGTIAEDVQTLVNGRYMAFGVGTFGPGICHLSDKIKAVFYYSPGMDPGFAGIPAVERSFEVVDQSGKYIKRGEWQNTEEQRRMMVEFPGENLMVLSPA